MTTAKLDSIQAATKRCNRYA